MSNTEQAHTITTADGLRLEAALHDGTGDLAAVVLHPHTLYGGDMDNHVVRAVCNALGDVGATTLRFNFRGAGGSEGAFDSGRGEVLDAVAAVAFVRDRTPHARLVLAGYSFGAGVASHAAAEAAPDAMILVSPPPGTLAPPDGVQALIVTGEHDRIAPPDSVQALAGPDRTVVIVPGVDHVWWPGIDELASLVADFARTLSSARTPSP